MSLKEKLEALRAKELREWEEEKVRREEERKLAHERWEKAGAELKRLKKIAAAKLYPSLELINEIYLEGRGSVSLKEAEQSSRHPWIELELNWDLWSDVKDSSGKRLRVRLGNNLDVELKGAEDLFPSSKPEPVVKVSLSLYDKNWKQKLEDGLYLILTTPKACEWRKWGYRD